MTEQDRLELEAAAFRTLVEHLRQAGFVLIDCQMPTNHLHSLGAHAISRAEFARYLARHLDQPNSATWVVA